MLKNYYLTERDFNMNELTIMLSDDQLGSIRQSVYNSIIDEISKARNDVGLEKRYLTKKEACIYLHIANNTLDKWIEKGLPKITIGGSVRFDKRAIEDWMEVMMNLS